MASFNKITIVGYLGRDPELRYTPQGTPVCDFSVATTERRKDKAGELPDALARMRAMHRGDPIGGRYRPENHRGDDFFPPFGAGKPGH